MPTTMKAFELQRAGELELFGLVERPRPQPNPGEIVLRMRAAALNSRDHQIASGTYHVAFPLPLVPLSDGVGEVVALGEGVTRFAPGDRVAGAFWQRWSSGECSSADVQSSLGGPLDGMLAEYVKLDEQGAVKVPSYLSDEEAATLPCAGVTAWRALVAEGQIRSRDSVLIQGTGGVSMFALQFARMSGALAIVVSRSPDKLERARTLGASLCVDARDPKWLEQVLAFTRGRGVDHIVDVAGPQSFADFMRVLRPGGQISVIGYLGGVQGEFNPLMLLERQAIVRGLQVGSRECFESMNRALEAHRIRPVIDSVHGWMELETALKRLRSMQHVGKIVLKF